MIKIVNSKKLDELYTLLRRLNREVIEWQTNFDNLKNNRDKILEISNQETSSLSARLDSEVQSNKKLSDKMKKLELELFEKKEDNEKLGKATGGLRSSNNRLIEKNKKLIKENKNLEDKLKLISKSADDLYAVNNKLKSENKSLVDMVQKLQSKINSLKNPKTLEEYKNDGLSKPQKESLKNIRRKRGK